MIQPQNETSLSYSTPRVAQNNLQNLNLDTMTFLHNPRCPLCTCRRKQPVENKMKKNVDIQRGRRFGVHKTPLGSSVSQDHTSQDHFCSLIDEFLTRNLDSDPPRWRVEKPGSERETVAESITSCPVSRHWGSFCLFEHLQRSQSCSDWSLCPFELKLSVV